MKHLNPNLKKEKKVMRSLIQFITVALCTFVFSSPVTAEEKTDSAPLASMAVELALGCHVDGGADWNYGPSLCTTQECSPVRARGWPVDESNDWAYAHDPGIFNAWLLQGPDVDLGYHTYPETGIHLDFKGANFDYKEVAPWIGVGVVPRIITGPYTDFGIDLDDVNTEGVASWKF